MSRYNLADRDSSTLIYATDSLDDMFELVSTMVADDGTVALEGLSLSMQSGETEQFDSFADDQVMLALQSGRAKAHADAHPRLKEPNPERQRWLLRMICWGKGVHPWTQIPFEKAAFLLQKSGVDVPEFDYKFTAYSYGPFDPQVTADLDNLVAQGCLTVRSMPYSKAKEYRLTDWGRKRVADLKTEVSAEHREVVIQVATRVTGKPYTDMLEELYDEFPDMAKRSVFRRRLKPFDPTS